VEGADSSTIGHAQTA
jgi:hypothetical protein